MDWECERRRRGLDEAVWTGNASEDGVGWMKQYGVGMRMKAVRVGQGSIEWDCECGQYVVGL